MRCTIKEENAVLSSAFEPPSQQDILQLKSERVTAASLMRAHSKYVKYSQKNRAYALSCVRKGVKNLEAPRCPPDLDGLKDARAYLEDALDFASECETALKSAYETYMSSIDVLGQANRAHAQALRRLPAQERGTSSAPAAAASPAAPTPAAPPAVKARQGRRVSWPEDAMLKSVRLIPRRPNSGG